MGILTDIRTRARQAAMYRRTLAELRRQPRATLADIGILEGDFEEIAAKSVYGNQ